MMKPDCDVIVIGGGIAGLSAAWELRDRDVRLLEAAPSTSGRVRSARRGDYWVNLGAQMLAGEGPLHDYVSELGVKALPVKSFKPAIAMKDKLVASDSPLGFVFRLPLSLRGRAQLIRAGLRLRRDYRRLTHNRDQTDARRFRNELDETSAANYFADVSDPDVNALFRDLIRFWMGVEPDEVSAGHTLVYIGYSVMPASELPPPFFPSGGNEEIGKALTQALGDKVAVNARVNSVRTEEGGVRVVYEADGDEFALTASECIVAVPAHVAGEIIEGLDDDYARALGEVHYGQYVLAGIFTNEERSMPWEDLLSVTVVGRSFQSLFNHALPLRGGGIRKPGGSFIVYAGGDPARQLLQRPDDDIKQAFLQDLYEMFPQLRSVVEDVLIQRWPEAIPYWHPGGRKGKDLLRSPMGSIHFAGDYIAYPSMQTAAISGKNAAQSVASRLAGEGT